MQSSYHIPVLLNEALLYLDVKAGALYVDCTLGGGGHTKGILERKARVIAIDQDDEALENARQEQKDAINQRNLILEKGNFAHLQTIVSNLGFQKVSGVLFDLGVSSHQLDADYRGFSFNKNATLDMRMDRDLGVTAKDLINAASANDLADIFWKFGEERESYKIARAIVGLRKVAPIETTDQLAGIISKVSRRGKGDRTHPATRVFQALRIAVNSELESLEEALPQAVDILEPGGRLVVITFHSLEDRIVKSFLQKMGEDKKLSILTKHVVKSGNEEVDLNPRARSGKLRAAIKLSSK